MKHKHIFSNTQTFMGLNGESLIFDKVCKCGLTVSRPVAPVKQKECKCLCHGKLYPAYELMPSCLHCQPPKSKGRDDTEYAKGIIKGREMQYKLDKLGEPPQTDKTTGCCVYFGTMHQHKKNKIIFPLPNDLIKAQALDAYRGKVKKLKKDNNWAVRDYKNGYNKAIDDALLEIEREI